MLCMGRDVVLCRGLVGWVKGWCLLRCWKAIESEKSRVGEGHVQQEWLADISLDEFHELALATFTFLSDSTKNFLCGWRYRIEVTEAASWTIPFASRFARLFQLAKYAEISSQGHEADQHYLLCFHEISLSI